MRILIASDLHWPSINGVATFGQNLAQGLVRAGHEAVVIAPSQTGHSGEEVDGNYRVLRMKSSVFPLYQDLRISVLPGRQVARVVEDFAPDVIHVQTPLGVGLAAIAVARRRTIPLVLTNHSMSENLIENVKILTPLSKTIGTWLLRYGQWFCSKGDYVTLPTQAAIEMLRPDGFRKPTQAISNGIDLSRFHPGEAPRDFRDRFGIPPHVPVVLYLGRVDAEKHLSVLLQAMHELGSARAVHLVVVGFGVDLHHLERLGRSLGIQDRVRSPAASRRPTSLTSSASPTSSPCRPPPNCRASRHSKPASGLPVVAVNAGALPELCEDGHNGFPVRPRRRGGHERSTGENPG